MLFIFCFLLASAIWVVNALSKTYVTEINYSLTSPAASGKDNIPVKVTLRGQGFTLWRIHMRLNNNEYPFSTFNPAMSCIEFTDSLLGKLRNDVSLVDVKPAVLKGTVSKGQITKMVAITKRIQVSYAQRFGSSIGILTRPDSVEIAGPVSILDTLKSVYTEQVKTENLKAPLFRSVAITSPSSECWLKQDRIWIYIPVEEYTEVAFEIPVTYNSSEEKTQIIPEVVKLFCQVPVSRYKKVHASLFKITPVTDELMNGKATLKVIKHPSFVKNIRTEPRYVTLLEFSK